jgi:hypothetical protein
MFSIPKIFESTARFTARAIAGGLHEQSEPGNPSLREWAGG